LTSVFAFEIRNIHTVKKIEKMRTKTTLLSAVAMAAGLVSSVAQSNVYSVNIVGYVNATIPANQFALLANPLSAPTNDVVNLGASLPNKSSIQIWNGTGFTVAGKASGVWDNNFLIPPGTGFFVKTPSTAGTITNTFVGNVIVGPGQTNTVALPGGVFSLLGSPIPFAGDLNSSGPNTLNLGNSLPNKSSVQTWNGTGFVVAGKASGVWDNNLTIGVAQGFFVKPASSTNWSQVLQ
jgi:hypothetical protein